jgi:hypothetical protein
VTPSIQRLRVKGKPPRAVPFGVAAVPFDGALEEGDAVWVAPDAAHDATSLSLTLPEPASLGRGFVVIGPTVGESGLFSRLLGREVRIARAVRGSALLLAGYRNIGGGVDPVSGLDLCWGEV